MPKPHSLTRTLVLVAFALLSLASLTSSLDAALMEAVRSNDVHATRSLLLQGHSPNTPSQDKADTPLHIACQNDFLLIIELLLQHHACVSAQDHLGLTPLHYSAYYGYTRAVAQLLEAGAGEHADLRDKSGKTALDLSKKNNHFEIVSLLEPHTTVDWKSVLESKEALSTIVIATSVFIATVYWINNVAITRKRTAGQRARALSAEGRKLKKTWKNSMTL